MWLLAAGFCSKKLAIFRKMLCLAKEAAAFSPPAAHE